MDNVYVISPTMTIAEGFCRNILEVNPRKHSISLRSPERLRGLDKPVIILYPWYQPDLWGNDFDSCLERIFQTLEPANATLIRMPEVSRVSRVV